MITETITFLTKRNGDLYVELPPKLIQKLGFPHGFNWSFDGDKIVATQSRSRMSNRQRKKFIARFGLETHDD